MDHQRNIITPDARKFVFTRRLPITGQIISYQAGDDGDYQAGWDIGQRFLPKTLSGDDVVIDRATGLMWPQSSNGPGGCNGIAQRWSNAIIWCGLLNFAGFTDWRMPNIVEFFSMYDFSVVGGPVEARDWPPFDLTRDPFWTSTTKPLTTNAWVMFFGGGGIVYVLDKDDEINVLAVREICQ